MKVALFLVLVVVALCARVSQELPSNTVDCDPQMYGTVEVQQCAIEVD